MDSIFRFYGILHLVYTDSLPLAWLRRHSGQCVPTNVKTVKPTVVITSREQLNGNYTPSVLGAAVLCWDCRGKTCPQAKGTFILQPFNPAATGTSDMAQRRVKKAFLLDLPQRNRARIKAEADAALQVIGAGPPRSGTTSLKAALEIIGFDPCHHMAAGFVRSFIHSFNPVRPIVTNNNNEQIN